MIIILYIYLVEGLFWSKSEGVEFGVDLMKGQLFKNNYYTLIFIKIMCIQLNT